METIQVKTGAPYQVRIGRGLLADLGQMILELPGKRYQKLVVVSDDIVHGLYGERAKAALEGGGYQVLEYTLPHGEGSKSMEAVAGIMAFLCENYVTRSDAIVALGGGVMGDLAGFAASIYQRGVDYIQVPTTFLAAIDSSVGGKTAVNIPQGKNLVGSFWQPKLVVCDVDTLSTLSPEIFADGVAEALKYGCIWDEELFQRLAGDALEKDIEGVIARCVAIKAQVVEEDEQDNGLRQILNFGHTCGHGVEKLSGFTISHGKGVAIGMVLAARAGERAGITEAGTADRIESVLAEKGLPTASPYGVDELAAACLGDKKRGGDSINLILLEKMGKYRIHPVKTDNLEEFLGGYAVGHGN